MIEYKPIRHHISWSHEPTRLCDGQPAVESDILIGDMQALREARGEAVLCPVCQLKSGYQPFSLRLQPWEHGRRTLAYLYSVPVLHAFDDIRNCAHCREDHAGRTCKAWHEARKRVLHREARRVAREVSEVPGATGGRPATIYEFLDGSVGYFALGTPPWQEAGEITGKDLLAIK